MMTHIHDARNSINDCHVRDVRDIYIDLDVCDVTDGLSDIVMPVILR